MSREQSTADYYLPVDQDDAVLVGRIWSKSLGGPVPVLVRNGKLLDISGLAPTISQLFERERLITELNDYAGVPLGAVADIFRNPAWEDNNADLKLLAPIDLQCIKACGVTFSVSVMERIVEERAGGDFAGAESIRQNLRARFGSSLESVKPGSQEAARLKDQLIAEGLWSQYLEVAIGPDAEVFTKAPTLSAVTWGDYVGIRDDSSWNNPEPEVVLICNSRAEIIGATLGNDVNLRDFEGRSALLLGKGKDNNASTSLGPFIRLLDSKFPLSKLLNETVSLTIRGEDNFSLQSENSMSTISRSPLDLVQQTCGKHHQYPDGFALYLGSLFAPTKDRDCEGKGFTHHIGDVVEISCPAFGRLLNKVVYASDAPKWQFGIAALWENLARRGLIG